MSPRFEVDIFAYVINVTDRHVAYREGAKKHAKEEQRIWEDLRHGIFLGTKKFVQKIKKRYLLDVPDGELPRQRQLSQSLDTDAVLIQAAEILNCRLEQFRKAARVSQSDILDRDADLFDVAVGSFERNRLNIHSRLGQ